MKEANSSLGISDLDLKPLFEALPGLYLVLNPDLMIVAVSEAKLEATMPRWEEVLGRALVDVFQRVQELQRANRLFLSSWRIL